MGKIAVAALAAVLVMGGAAARADRPLKIQVSVAPQKYFVERLGGERVTVTVMAGPGQSPHTLDPTPRQVAALMEADLYVRAGMPFEEGLLGRAAAARSDLRVVDQREGIELRPLAAHEEEGGEGEDRHHAGELDPHVWMSPRLAKVEARTLARALAEADPAGKPVYEANLTGFLADLDRVDGEIARALADLPVREFFVFHPALGYFAETYGLRQTAVESAGKEPGPRQLARLIDRARAAGVKVIFVQPQFSTRGAETLARALGAAVVPLDPLAEDYLANLERVARTLADALGAKGK